MNEFMKHKLRIECELDILYEETTNRAQREIIYMALGLLKTIQTSGEDD